MVNIKRILKNRIYLLTLISVFILLISTLLYSCGINLFSVQDDVEIGRDIDKEIRSSREFPILKSPQEINDYVSNIGKNIVKSSPMIKYKDVFPYQFTVIHDSVINAFCTPGGFIYVYTGLIKYLDNEAALAGVIGHEIAHAERRHMTQRLSSYYGTSFLLSIILGNNPNSLAEIMANLFVGLGFLANSRSDEQEADDLSIRYLRSTKYFPGSILFFFNRIVGEQKQKGNTPGGLDRLLSTHPLPQDRVENAYKQLKELKIPVDTVSNIYREDYLRIKSLIPNY